MKMENKEEETKIILTVTEAQELLKKNDPELRKHIKAKLDPLLEIETQKKKIKGMTMLEMEEMLLAAPRGRVYPNKRLLEYFQNYLRKLRDDHNKISCRKHLLKMFNRITDIFPVYGAGIVTARDKLTIKSSPEEALSTVKTVSEADENEARLIFNLGIDTRDWKLKNARQDIIENGVKKEYIVPILYRPFDIRYTYYTGKSRGYISTPRFRVMRHMLEDNMGLILVKKLNADFFNHCLVTGAIIDNRITQGNKSSVYLFPLYLYPENKKNKSESSQPNINPVFIRSFNKYRGVFPGATAEQVFCFIYAVLFSTIYRKKFSEELKSDFPRIPITARNDLFTEMVKLGEKLVELHLMKSPELEHTVSTFEDMDNNAGNMITEIRYLQLSRMVYINESQYFSNISKEMWEYRMLGYQVMAKWLKSRLGRKLSSKDIAHYIKIARVIELTVEYQKQIDSLYPKVEDHSISFLSLLEEK